MAAPYPEFIPEAFALNADPSRRNVIPETTANPQRASWDIGFPPNVMTPVVAGGRPMLGPDMNGALYMISSHAVYAQSGQPYRWNADVVAAIIGYDAGTLLGSTDGLTLWMNLVDGNTTDPDDAAATNWTPVVNYGSIVLPPSAGGLTTLTPQQAKYSLIVITGALAGNLTVVFPTQVRRWLLVNATTGSFTTTARTASGTGVAIPQGGYANPVEIYCDGTNINNVVAPLSVPTAVAPTPDTYVLRSNAGYVYATYFNQSSAPENFPISAFFAETGSDGFHRKISLANALAQILANPNLTGVATAPTPASGDNSTKIATTAFVQTPVAGAVNNYQVTFPGLNGFQVKFGYVTGVASTIGVTFNEAFPNNALAAFCCTNRTSAGGTASNFCASLSTTGATFIMDARSGVGSGFGGWWIAVGN